MSVRWIASPVAVILSRYLQPQSDVFPSLPRGCRGVDDSISRNLFNEVCISPASVRDAVASPALRRLAWFNIAVQVAFPLAVAFPGDGRRTAFPAAACAAVHAAHAGLHWVPVRRPSRLQKIRSHPEPAARAQSVAHLRARTQWSAAWDDVDVPLMAAKDNKNASDAAAPAGLLPQKRAMSRRRKWPGMPHRLAASGQQCKSDAAASMARNMATVEAGGAFQQWLSHFGTARVQLDADKTSPEKLAV